MRSETGHIVILSEAKEAISGHGLLRFAQDDKGQFDYAMFPTIASPNSEVLSSVAPGISRSKS